MKLREYSTLKDNLSIGIGFFSLDQMYEQCVEYYLF